MTSTEPPPRRRDAAATRAAILVSAREAFARLGYDGAGVREIAAGAGVTAMMVNRYFGSKEALFAEVVVATMSTPTILAAENLQSRDMAERMATALVNLTEADAAPLEGFQIMLRSASSGLAAKISREQIELHHQKTLASTLTGPLAAQRAALVLALVAGVQVMRQMIALSPLTKASPKSLVKLLTPIFQQLVEGQSVNPEADRPAARPVATLTTNSARRR